ncbi:uncharacterized protein LOC115985364 [Quercus lobata]|uniref:uncharacterized protein LOC115985364 n=1 Tax=Quercus lobata TaxID=97700 RepID=UPI0012459599|nr:uncharacterized protein LOC115985364 [Quercus lobata]
MTLKGPSRIWFSRLTPSSINTFKELNAQFTSHFIGGHRYKRSTTCLMSIKQREDETLRAYITRFNKKVLSIDEADDKILVAAFTNGLRKGKFLFSLYKNDPKTMTDMLYRATKYMNAEDALLTCEEKPKKKERQEDTRQDKGRKVARTGDQRDERRPTRKFTNFTPLTASIDQVLMQIKDEGALTFPGKLKGDPNKRPRDKYCHFHRDHEHDTANCYDLNSRLRPLSDKGSYREDDTRRLHHPHDDALVVSLQIGDYNMHRVLVDNGSSADNLYYLAFQQMRIDRERLTPTNAPLVGFGGTKVFPLGAITLAVTVGDYL